MKYKVVVICGTAAATFLGLFVWSEIRGAASKQKLLEAEESCQYQIDEMDKQAEALREEIKQSAETCDVKISDERQRCDGLVTTYRELLDVEENKKTVIHELKEDKAKAYEAIYRRLGYLPPAPDPE